MQEQEHLQVRLQKALKIHLHPKTSVDTTTVADKIVRTFDDMLQVSAGSLYPQSSCANL